MDEMKPYPASVLINFIMVGMSIFSKLAFTDGQNVLVYTFYRTALATFFLAPWAFHERKRAPQLSPRILVANFMLALLGNGLSQLLWFLGLDYTTPTVASAFSNSLPVTTFFLAVLFRMESFKLQSWTGVIKLISIVLCLSGVTTIAFYNGPVFPPFQHIYRLESSSIYIEDRGHWVKGTTFLVANNAACSMWLVLQGKVLMEYPSVLISTFLQCFFGMMQTLVVAITFERDLSMWKLGLNMNLIALTYCAIIVSGLGQYLQTWVIEKKGPVFLVAFIPLNMVLTIPFSMIFLKETISLGSILGGVQLIGCLYLMLWGKSQEQTALYQTIIEHDERETT